MPADSTTTSATSRRAVLAAGAAAVTSGCVRQTRAVLGRGRASQVSVKILTVPADSNPYPLKIARALAENLATCGVDAQVEPMGPEALYRAVLLNHNYDLYVGQFHGFDWADPDQLYSVLHSVYAGEPGWQNPFGYTDLRLDEHLELQRTATGARRRRAVEDVQRAIAETQPFTPVAFPDELSTVRNDRFSGWYGSPSDPLTLLGIAPVDDDRSKTLRLTTTDGRITENRNPLAAEFRNSGTFIDLLYDPLGRRIDEVVRPWLAAAWRFTDRGAAPTATLTIRDGATWHDGEPITADDVAFTYRFLEDTSLGRADSPIPASRFRGRASLVDEVTAVDDRRLEIQFVEASTTVAKRAFTVPVLPKHVWSERTGNATIAGLETNRQVTEALVWNNPEPVGSGPLQFERAVPDESLRLSRFEDHFLAETEVGGSRGPVGLPTYDEVRVQATGSDDAAVELVAGGDADATVAPLGPGVVPRIGRNQDLQLIGLPSKSLYHIGFNTRQTPLSNPRFRQIVARLLDKGHVVSSVFDGYASPVASPLAGTGWLASELAWNGTDPATPFFGADGDLEAGDAREAFVEAGYRYDDGQLLDE